MMAFALKLLLAHLIGDFLLQPKKWVLNKEQRKFKSPFLYLHVGIHFLLLLLIFDFQMDFLWAFVIICVSHYAIDLLKLSLTGKASEVQLFIADQLAHFVVLLLVVNYYFQMNISQDQLFSEHNLLLFISLLFVTVVTSILMKYLMATFRFEEDQKNDSLKDAGQYIGVLERLFVFGFIILGQWQVIGFLLAAKSVFRFGDLSRSKDRKLTEYILIGTLLSFGFAIVLGLVYLACAKMISV
jgi:hypothetical protein